MIYQEIWPGADNVSIVLNVLSGFSLGASSIAFFARVGGGIYTKAADVGADLVGKVEAGIPEDHPLNPATIADNVGDNVGDVAGMGADLFESYVGSIIGTMVLGAYIFTPDFDGLGAVYLPLVLAAVGIIMSIIGTFFVKVKDGGNPQTALNIGEFGSAGLMVAASYFIIHAMIPETVEGLPFGAIGVFWATIAGLVAGLGVGKITEYYTGTGTKPVSAIVTTIRNRSCNKYNCRSWCWNDVYGRSNFIDCHCNFSVSSFCRTIRYRNCRSWDVSKHRNSVGSRCLRTYF